MLITPPDTTSTTAKSNNLGVNGEDGDGESCPTMQYACQACSKRKTKCDKTTPSCSGCRKSRLECIYQAPPPRQRKRRRSGDVEAKLARYETILGEHGLLPGSAEATPPASDPNHEPVTFRFDGAEGSKLAKVTSGYGKSRFVNNFVWRSLGEDMQPLSEDEEEDEHQAPDDDYITGDPVTGAFIAPQRDLLQYHPTHAEAMTLWAAHVENVEPICKILHIPSTSKMVRRVSQQSVIASKAEECLLFAIYHFAVFSMTDEECVQRLYQSRHGLTHKYRFATRQALVNASFLRTTKFEVMQALVLFLMPTRFHYDPQVYWILTGVAVRIAQRIGIHKDGEAQGLPPFEVQMRRRLFYQLIPLDGLASQMSGTGISIVLQDWDTQSPSNINDDQIWPGMTEKPEEQTGATEMMFCLTRACIGKRFAKAGAILKLKDYTDAEPIVQAAENEVEEKFLRYCDIVNPLHFLSIGLARSALQAMRIRLRLPRVRNGNATYDEKREIFHLAQKCIDTDTAAYSHPNLRKYLWHGRSFFAWGSWDSLIFMLTSLRNGDLLSPQEVEETWKRVEQMYDNHHEMYLSKQALHIAVGRLTLKVWDAGLRSNSQPEPAFIVSLRSQLNPKTKYAEQIKPENDAPVAVSWGSMLPADTSMMFGDFTTDNRFDLNDNFDFDTLDWDQLIKDYQAQGG